MMKVLKKKWGLLPTIVIAVLFMTSCSGSAPSASWPELTVAGGTVYAALTDGRVHALDADTGSEKWVFPAEVSKPSGLPQLT